MADPAADLAALLATVAASRRGQEMATRLYESLELTDALWGLVPVVVAASERYHERTPTEVADSSPVAALLKPERRQSLRQLGDRLQEVTTSALEAQSFDESVLTGISRTELLADPFGFVNRVMDTPAYIAQVLEGLGPDLTAMVNGSSTGEAAYLAAYVQAVEAEPKTPALLRALFAAAIGTVEPLVGRMVMILLYEQSPGSYSSLADPQLDKRARTLCRGAPGMPTPEAWRKALVEDLGLSSLANAVDWAGLAQLWEARNVVAHRGGIVDARYSQRSQEEVGSLVASEPVAVRAAIDQIGAIRFAIVAAVWDHLSSGMGTMVAQSTGIPAVEQSPGRPLAAGCRPGQGGRGLRLRYRRHRHR